MGISGWRDLSVHTGIDLQQTQFMELPHCYQSVPIWIYSGLGPVFLQLGEGDIWESGIWEAEKFPCH